MTVTSEDLDIRIKDVRVKIVAAVKGDSNIIGYVKDESKITFNDGKKDLGGGFRFLGKFSEGGSVMTVLAIWFLFQPDATAWFAEKKGGNGAE